ncbi:hypothetical protein JCM19301_2863 [Jejuia pallidilutea]|uniref:Uncharacterized protein n=1 Tax=Jejuia pallidilutea TaxID=504487 RepID=A0A090VTB1_9FLAO|nr:hypothetical protein JCM19301_2863 [Jejuia pallidilutea]
MNKQVMIYNCFFIHYQYFNIYIKNYTFFKINLKKMGYK